MDCFTLQSNAKRIWAADRYQKAQQRPRQGCFPAYTTLICIERGINFTDTTKYGIRKLGVLYDSAALDWDAFARKAGIAFSEVNNPIQLTGQAPRSKYIEDQLKMGAEVIITDTKTNEVLIKFDSFPDDQNLWEEYRRRIRENLERANKIIADGVAKAKDTGSLGAQVVIRPVEKRAFGHKSNQKSLDTF